MIIEQTKQHHDEGSKPIVVAAQCLKITEKSHLTLRAKRATYVYILSDHKKYQEW